MQLSRLQLHQFRSHTQSDFQFDPRLTAIIGPNGSGKTNILEAIYALCTGKSFRDSDDELTTYAHDWWQIKGNIDETNRELRYQPKEKGKQLLLDDTLKGRFTYRQQLPVVLFEPDDLLMVHSTPGSRRRYLDDVLQRHEPHFRTVFQRYERVLAQRNNLLKQRHSLNQTRDAVFVWDISLAELGAQITAARLNLIERLNTTISEVYSQIAGASSHVLLRYETRLSQAHESSSLVASLAKHLPDDLIRGFTTSGPHRDDVEFMINDKNAKYTASRGEIRSLVLSLKRCEVELLTQKHHTTPLFLLDDVFSELDTTRQAGVMNHIDVQTIFTTTELKTNTTAAFKTIQLA